LHSCYNLTPDTEFSLSLSAVLPVAMVLVRLSFSAVIFPGRTLLWRRGSRAALVTGGHSLAQGERESLVSDPERCRYWWNGASDTADIPANSWLEFLKDLLLQICDLAWCHWLVLTPV